MPLASAVPSSMPTGLVALPVLLPQTIRRRLETATVAARNRLKHGKARPVGSSSPMFGHYPAAPGSALPTGKA